MLENMFLITTLMRSLFSLPVYRSAGSQAFTPQDAGYEINEDDLVTEMRYQQQVSLNDHTPAEVDPDEFEAVYTWFLA
jgi:hypothetical protein